VATHAGTVAPGWLELETGAEVDRHDSGVHTFGFPVVFKLGIAKPAQLSLFTSFLSAPGNGFSSGDLGVGVKLRLLEGAPVLGDFSIFPSLKFPTGSTQAGSGTGTTDASLLLISSHEVGPVAIDLNAGYTRRGGDGVAVSKDAFVWTASFGGKAAGMLGWVAELFGYPATSGPAGQPGIVAALAGPTFLLRPWLSLDTGIIVALSGSQPDAWYLGGVWNIGQVWR